MGSRVSPFYAFQLHNNKETFMISFGEVRRFLQEEQFVRVTDFAKCLKRRHKNGKLRDKHGKTHK